VRIGIHTGAAFERGGDYYGSAVNRAARIMMAAEGGHVLVSALTRQLSIEQGIDARFVDLGEHQLKGFEDPERLFQLVTGDDELAITVACPTVTVIGAPYVAGSLIGRESDLAAVSDLLVAQQVVSLVGTGGVRK